MNIELQDPRKIVIGGTVQELLEQVSVAQKELNNHRPFSAEVDQRIRRMLLPDRIVASLNMEGIAATRRQTLAVMDAIRVNENVGHGQQEILNTLKADEFVADIVESGIVLSEQVIREIHKLLMNDVKKDAGTFRNSPVELPGAPFQPPSAIDVPDYVANLCDMFNLGESLPPIVHSAWLHAQFTLIHPFSDGNGRTGRLLQDYALIRRGYLPVGIPTSKRDDYYSALEHADIGEWNELVEMLSMLELEQINKTLAVAKAPEQRKAWINDLSRAASSKKTNARHKNYLVWRHRMEELVNAITQAAEELDQETDVIGVTSKIFPVVDFPVWKEICQRGTSHGTWAFSLIFFADGNPFYKVIGYFKRHRVLPRVDTFESPRDSIGLFITGVSVPEVSRPNFQQYTDPHIRLREILFVSNDMYVYREFDVEDEWICEQGNSIEEIVQEFFGDVFYRKAGLGG